MAVLTAVLYCLSACTTLPAPEALAFHKIADADKIRFTGITEIEREAVTGMTVREVAASRGRINYENCAAADRGACRLNYQMGSLIIGLDQSAPRMRKLVAQISDYGAHMAELAEAKDIGQAADNAGAAADAVAGLAGIVGVPFAKPVLDLAVDWFRSDLVAKRQKLLLDNALAAQPVITAASVLMSKIAKPVQTNILAAAGIDLENAGGALDSTQATAAALEAQAAALRKETERGGRGADQRLAMLDRTEERLADLRAQRAADADALIRASGAVNAARRIDIDFSPLAKGHDALVARLEDPKGMSLEESLAQINRFLTVLDAFAAADGS